MQKIDLQGVSALEKELDRIRKRLGPRIGARAITAAMRSLVSGIKKAIPSIQTKGHSAKRLKSAVGSRRAKGTRNLQLGKVGFRVGRGGKKAKAAPHAHLFVLGTQERTRRRIGGRFRRYDRPGHRSTGAARSNPNIVARGVSGSIGRARQAMRRTATRELQKQRRK